MMEGNANSKELMNRRPLYLRIEEQFAQEEQVQEQRIRSQLERRKLLYKPLDRNELDQHALWVADTKQELSQVLRD